MTDAQTIDHPSPGADPASPVDPPADPALGVDPSPSQDPQAQGASDDGADDWLTKPLFSDEDMKGAGEKAKQLESYNKAWTTKTQRLSDLRKKIEPYAEFIDALEEDAAAAITAIAPNLGLEIRDPKAASPTHGNGTDKAVASAVDGFVSQYAGTEYEDFVKTLAPGLNQFISSAVAEGLKPVRAQQDELVRDSSMRESAASLEAFSKVHPDWKTHEAKMVDLGQRLQPAQGMPALEWLDVLYTLATKDQHAAQAAKALAARVESSAKAAATSDRGVSPDKVATRPPGRVSFQDAYSAAKRGETIE